MAAKKKINLGAAGFTAPEPKRRLD